jgi:hypothetical protein
MEMVCDSGVKDGSVSGSCIMGHIDLAVFKLQVLLPESRLFNCDITFLKMSLDRILAPVIKCVRQRRYSRTPLQWWNSSVVCVIDHVIRKT